MCYRLKDYSWMLLFIMASIMHSCTSEKDEAYDRPSWLKGNAWEVLSKRADFSMFMKAIEKAGFKDLANGKGVVTVLAPTDAAFNAYLLQKGYPSLDAIPLNELKKIVGYHLVYYSYDKGQFANYQPEGAGNLNTAKAGLYYKHRTKSRDSITTLLDPSDNRLKNIFHKERFVPVFSSYMFDTKKIAAKYNYEYFYPSSTWTGDGGGFNISNASVTEYAIVTDNGYIHIVDQVVEPLETVHAELEKATDYSLFVSMYDRFTNFWYDEATSKAYTSPGDSLYILEHLTLPQIASEWSYNGESGLPDYANLADLSYKAFNVFAPNEDALSAFFNSYWGSFYNSIDEIGYIPIAYLLYNHVYQGSIVFPEEITKGQIKSAFGNIITFDPNTQVATRKVCVNGAFYGLKDVIVPDMFKSVTGPLFQNPKYKLFLYMAAYTGMIEPLMSNALDYTLFIPSDDVILNTIYLGSNIYWNEGNPQKYGDEVIEVDNADGIKVAMSQKAMSLFVSNHIVTGKVTELSGKKVYRTRNPFSYLYVTDKGVASSITYNQAPASQFVMPTEITGSWSNGKSYDITSALVKEEGAFKYLIGSATSGTSPLQDYSEFSKLLATAGLIDANSELSFLFGDNFILFAPTNKAITDAKALGLIPTVKADLANYLKYYFVPISANSLTDYPFIGSGIQGNLSTSQTVGGLASKITLSDSGSLLQLSNKNGQTVDVVSDFPRIYTDGAIYQISNVLKSE